MVQIITSQNKAAFEREFLSMLEDRKRVFVDLLKWDIPVTGGCYEIDRFDNDAAIYFLISDSDGSHLGSLRLLRADRPHILDSFFSSLCRDGVPTGPDVAEITRLCLSPRLRASERLKIRNRLISALVDYSLASGITSLTGVVTANFREQVLAMGWRCKALGSAQKVAGSMIGAFRIEVDDDTPARLEATGIYTPDTLIEDKADGGEFHPGKVGPAANSVDALSKSIEYWTAQLLADGYCVIPNAISADSVEALNRDIEQRFALTPFCKGGFYGRRTKRFGGLLKRSPIAAEFIQHPLILAITEKILGPWCDRFNLNLSQGIELHPGAPAQFPHRDQDMWQGPKGQIEYLLNVMWPLSEFTAENGATLIWPGSHHPGALDSAPHGPPVVAEMPPGSVLLFLGSTLHAAGGNYTRSIRRGMIVSYCLGWLKPFENQWLSYPPEVAKNFGPELAALIGYSQHRPNLGNYEGQCPSILLRGDQPEYLAATDALRPDQEAALESYVASQATVGADDVLPAV